ncbi:hypothetical protein AB0L99_07970 [Streptomyces sp. NPDC051954]|uniref:hypothetical protein n=1 Tax=unclassified Streptomyces TaxID=2593676 RepID=UPI0034442FF5
MRFHRTTPARVFSGFSATLLRDRRIAWCAVGVLTYLLALLNGVRVPLCALAAQLAAALRELEELRGAGGAGQLPVVHEVFDVPCEVESPMGETEKVRDRNAPRRHTARAAQLLISLGQIDSRLTLDATEALRLAPLVEGWWARGVSSAQVRAALVYGWPPQPVRSARALLEDRLRLGRPLLNG